MTPRDHLLADAPAGPDDPAAERARLGRRALARCLAAAEALGAVLPGVDAEHATDGDARLALPGVLRAALDALDVMGDDAANDLAVAGRDRDLCAALRSERAVLRELGYHLHAAARVARTPIAAREGP